MIARAIIHVTGQAGAGKTAFIEALVRAIDCSLLVARCVHNDNLRRARESRPRMHRELRRYREAGASGVVLFEFAPPPRDDAADEFYMSEFMQDYSDAVVLEGENPLGGADLTVYVAAAPSLGQPLLVRRAAGPSERAKASSLRRLLSSRKGFDQLVSEMLGPPFVDFARRNPLRIDGVRRAMLDRLESTHETLPRKAQTRWAIATRLRGMEDAQLVVVNIRTETDRGRAERLITHLARLRKDRSVAADVFGPAATRIPITAVAANVVDPRDRGLKKAIARVKRPISKLGRS